LSLEENGSSGNAAHAAHFIVPLAAPSPEIDLWWCGLYATAPLLERFETYLSAAERDRAARFGDRRLRDRFVIGRASLRTILGDELGIDPVQVEIVRGARGRPQLAGMPSLDFNISHTHGVALVGIVQRARIGVDVERLDRVINVEGIARKFLTPGERSELAGRDQDAMRQRVLTLWTCKEAMSKATGDALSAPFASIDVDDGNPRRLRSGPGLYQAEAWSLHAASVPAGYVATIALWRPR
jgi:4'-phosphopantetheinyl transferase